MSLEISSSTGAEVWRKAPRAFPDSSSVLDKFQSVNLAIAARGAKQEGRNPAQGSRGFGAESDPSFQ